MEEEARSKGVNIRKVVSKKIDILVCCERCSQRKIQKAKEHGIEMLDEAEYVRRLNNDY